MTINISDKLICFGAGCGLGFVIGALFAPRAGQETRHNITSKVDNLSHKVQEKIHSAGIRGLAGEMRQQAISKPQNVMAFGRQQFDDTVDVPRRKFDTSIEDDDFSEG
jgi:gas vesicle protein